MIEASVPLMCRDVPDEDSGAVGGTALAAEVEVVFICRSDIYPLKKSYVLARLPTNLI
jgi:hypothetical protein